MSILFGSRGWRNATRRPGCSGSCLANASRLALGSRENCFGTCGPTEFRAGTVMDTPRPKGALAVVVVCGANGTGAAGGDCPRGRFRFSVPVLAASTGL